MSRARFFDTPSAIISSSVQNVPSTITAVGLLEERPDLRLDLAEPGRIEQDFPAARIGDAHADVVALARDVAMRRIRRRLAR